MGRAFINGSHGFIGEHLVSRLGEDNIIRGDRSGKVPSNVNVVFSLAAFGNMAGHSGDAGRIYRANLMRVIEENEWIDNEKWIYISTSSVTLPIQTPYSLSKKAAEEFLKNTGKKVAIVRPFSITGVGDQSEHLIPKLIDSCLHGTEMPFVSEPVHDYVDVEDLVDALLIIKDKAQFKGEIYEIGSGVQTSNDDIRVLIEDITGKKANLRLVESMRNYDTKDWRANNERICSLGWEPKIKLKKTIKEMINYAKKNS